MTGYGITATRSGCSVAGAAQGPVRGADGKPQLFPTFAEARAEAERLNTNTASAYVHYAADPKPQEIAP